MQRSMRRGPAQRGGRHLRLRKSFFLKILGATLSYKWAAAVSCSPNARSRENVQRGSSLEKFRVSGRPRFGTWFRCIAKTFHQRLNRCSNATGLRPKAGIRSESEATLDHVLLTALIVRHRIYVCTLSAKSARTEDVGNRQYPPHWSRKIAMAPITKTYTISMPCCVETV
jgi:hypothetical protein